MSRLDELKDYVSRLQKADKNDEAEFHRLVRDGFEFLALTDAAVARELDMSRPSVCRWRNGRNAPHPAMRPIVYRTLVRLAKPHVEVAERRPSTGAAAPERVQESGGMARRGSRGGKDC